jgi:2-oxoglutarate/2-oxoacid ferredoxin oxidoreductase subunit beta
VRFGPDGAYGLVYGPYGQLQAAEAVDRPSYDTLMAVQMQEAANGEGDLARLLAGNDTWDVG